MGSPWKALSDYSQSGILQSVKNMNMTHIEIARTYDFTCLHYHLIYLYLKTGI